MRKRRLQARFGGYCGQSGEGKVQQGCKLQKSLSFAQQHLGRSFGDLVVATLCALVGASLVLSQGFEVFGFMKETFGCE